MNKGQRKFFVTGTDTEIGKTFISAALLRALAHKGKKAAGLKPIASDAQPVQGIMKNEDALELQKAASMSLSYSEINPFCFEPAIAPHIAADLAGTSLSVERLQNSVIIPDDAETVLIEGAGGWLTPLNNQETYADWVEQSGFEVILVVGMKLGCLNHAMLSVRDIERRGLKLAGWVANFPVGKMNMAEDNVQWLKSNIEAPCLGIVPQQDASQDADSVSQLLDVSSLL
ncbi:dethiobiotin synthase [Kangiella sediminilitoris]|uniref:ATP-dependent dethiobiotin synthetase BioD n=1 Tax=Kangiella sediminilitoris TaxID=1144748 RepID=A0A1B3B8W2_9GAMM|nr:dethiobiotin synthase [Kangiella sediminilitoris]AOE49186.1 ATP-dependent dethiobiotin synthetase BioD [Kangiella sediminilitoris]